MLENKKDKLLFSLVIIILSSAAVFQPIFICLVLIILFISLFLCKQCKLSLNLIVVNILIFILSYSYTCFRLPQPDFLCKLAPSQIQIKAIVTTPVKQGDYNSKFEANVTDISVDGQKWKSVNARTLVLYNGKQSLLPYDRVNLKVYIKRPFEALNPGQFDYSAYLKNKYIFTIASANARYPIKVEKPRNILEKAYQSIFKLKDKVLNIHSKYLKQPYSDLMGGIVFGDYATSVSQDVKDKFVAAGLLHLLAASGMNVSIIYLFWFFIARKLKMPEYIIILTGAILVFLYSILTGMPPSVTRALIMIEFVLLGRLLDKESDHILFLSIAGVVMILNNPSIICDIGFQLSFLVTFGILYTVDSAVKLLKPVNPVIAGHVVVPIVAQLWALPVQLYNFGTLPIYSLPANILSVIPVEVVSFVGFAGSLLSFIPYIGNGLCFIADKICEPFLYALAFISTFISSIPGGVLSFKLASLNGVLAVYIFVAALSTGIRFSFKNRYFSTFIIFLLILALFFSYPTPKNDFKMTVLAVSKGDSTVIELPDNRVILIDAASSSFSKLNDAQSIILPYLNNEHIQKIDNVLITTMDSTHFGGINELQKKIQISNVYSPSKTTKLSDTKIIKETSEIFSDKDLTIKYFIPLKTELADKKYKSAAIYIRCKQFSFLFLDPVRFKSFDFIKELEKLHINVIRLGYHSKKKLLNIDFLRKLDYDAVVVSTKSSAGANVNNIYKTNIDGAIIFNIDIDRLCLDTFKTHIKRCF